MHDLIAGNRRANLPPPVFVHRVSVEAAEAFFTARAPDVRAIADPDGELFAAFGLQRASLWQLLGPSVWLGGLRALLKGHGIGKPLGDPMQMPGAFVVRGRRIVHAHRARHAAQQPKLATLHRHLTGT